MPNVLDMASTLWKMSTKAKSLKPLVNTLITSVKKLFRGIFINCLMVEGGQGSHEEPFADKVYMIAAVLDPKYMMTWVDAWDLQMRKAVQTISL